MTATRLTWRINRFEILFVLGVVALLGISAWVTADQIRGLGFTEAACWPRHVDSGNYATPACDAMMERFWPLTSQAGYIRVALSVAPIILGVILGAPIVAREIELRTVGFSWALTPSRARWLAARFLPMVVIGVVGLAILAWAGGNLFEAMWLGRYGPDLTEIGAQGLAVIARGLAAMAVALLVGALIGRTMAAFLIAAVVMAVWALVVVPQAQNVLKDQRSVWQGNDEGDDSWIYGDQTLAYADFGTFDSSVPGVPGEPGARVDEGAVYAEAEQRSQAACGESPEDPDDPDYDYDSTEYRTWSTCADPFYEEARQQVEYWNKVVPRSAWGDFAALDVAMSAVLGGVALILTWPVVARRRPD